MADTTISSLDEVVTPGAGDVLPIVSSGATMKVQAQNLRAAIPVASTTDKGLMSAADKTSLGQAQADIANLQAYPVIASAVSASTLAIPNGSDVVILLGATNIVTILEAKSYHTYTFHYPSGPGLSFLGVAMSAGDTLVAVYTP